MRTRILPAKDKMRTLLLIDSDSSHAAVFEDAVANAIDVPFEGGGQKLSLKISNGLNKKDIDDFRELEATGKSRH